MARRHEDHALGEWAQTGKLRADTVERRPGTALHEVHTPAICRSVVDIPAILRVNSFAEGQPYPLVWLDREAPPGARPAAETPEPPVEIGGGGEDSGVP
jgi:hypothetical protein